MSNYILNDRLGLVYLTQVTENFLTTINHENFLEMVRNYIGVESSKFLDKTKFEDLVNNHVIQIGVPALCSDFENFLESIVCLEIWQENDPYEGFRQDFGLDGESKLNKIVEIKAEDYEMAVSTLWYIEKDIHYAGASHSVSEMSLFDLNRQRYFLDAGYLLKVIGNKVIACKNINQSLAINIHTKDYCAGGDIIGNHLEAMAEYRPTPEDDSEIKVFVNSFDIHEAMTKGYLIADISGGQYICRRYAGMCDHLKNYEQEEQKVA